jgi:hypothetical protein
MINKCEAEIIAHSVDKWGNELISVKATYPSIILREVNTHRMICKNTSSSRAIPVLKMIDMVEKTPFIPFAFQKKHKGMQGKEYLEPGLCQKIWLKASKAAIESAKELSEAGATKQLCNRILDPYSWTTSVLTGTKEAWFNFFNQRCFRFEKEENGFYFSVTKKTTDYIYNPQFSMEDILPLNESQAEIHMSFLSFAIEEALQDSKPNALIAREKHICYKKEILDKGFNTWYGSRVQGEIDKEDYINTLSKVSTTMIARTSYTNLEVGGFDDCLELYDKLCNQIIAHASPFEHNSTVVTDYEYERHFKGREKGHFGPYKGFKSDRYVLEHD